MRLTARPPVLVRALPTALVASVAVLALAGCSDNVVGDEPDAPTGTASGSPAAPPATDAGVDDAEDFPITPAPGADLASVISDSETIAKALERLYASSSYPRTLREVRESLPDSGASLGIGNRLGGYVYDADAQEFELCVENAAGNYSTYDTAPMSVRDSGKTGGCTIG